MTDEHKSAEERRRQGEEAEVRLRAKFFSSEPQPETVCEGAGPAKREGAGVSLGRPPAVVDSRQAQPAGGAGTPQGESQSQAHAEPPPPIVPSLTREPDAVGVSRQAQPEVVTEVPTVQLPSVPTVSAIVPAQLQSAEDAALAPMGAMREINDKHCVITNLGGKCVIMEWVPSARNPAWEEPSYQTTMAFKERYANRYVKYSFATSGGSKTEVAQLGPWWLQHPQRRQHDGIDLVPNGPAVIFPGNRVNLWRGFGVQPVQGDWSLMQRHIREVLAKSDRASAEYILRWAAWKVQNAGKPPEVTLNFRGLKGTGKGAFAFTMLKIFGPHGMQISNREHLVGKHNKHLQNLLLLSADEAVWAGDHTAERMLKSLITETTFMVEPKGIDSFSWPNRLGIIQTTNDDWCVPATMDERRFAVFDVSSRARGDVAYFKALFGEVNRGGAEAMLWDLQRMDLDGWHPRESVPQTEALLEQKMQSLTGLELWWLAKLHSGVTSETGPKNPRWLLSTPALEDCKRLNPKAWYVNDTQFGRFMRDLGCEHKSTGSARGWVMPPLAEARRDWERRFGGAVDWFDKSIPDWNHGQDQTPKISILDVPFKVLEPPAALPEGVPEGRPILPQEPDGTSMADGAAGLAGFTRDGWAEFVEVVTRPGGAEADAAAEEAKSWRHADNALLRQLVAEVYRRWPTPEGPQAGENG